MPEVRLTADAYLELEQTPRPIQHRIAEIIERLQRWPEVSGVKPLRGKLRGSFRVRTGDYRVVFNADSEIVTIWKIGYRGDVYD